MLTRETIAVLRECSERSVAGEITFPEVVKKLVDVGIEQYHADMYRREKTYYAANGDSHVQSEDGLDPKVFNAEAVAAELNRDGVKEALRLIQPIKERAARMRATGSRLYNAMWHTALDVKHSVAIAETIILSALLRKESRAAHSRVDFPETSKELQRVNTVTKLADGKLTIDYVERDTMPDHLQTVIDEKTEVVPA